MSAAACGKIILNEELSAVLKVFSRFVEMEIVEDEDFREVTLAEDRLCRHVREVNQRIAERQDE